MIKTLLRLTRICSPFRSAAKHAESAPEAPPAMPTPAYAPRQSSQRLLLAPAVASRKKKQLLIHEKERNKQKKNRCFFLEFAPDSVHSPFEEASDAGTCSSLASRRRCP